MVPLKGREQGRGAAFFDYKERGRALRESSPKVSWVACTCFSSSSSAWADSRKESWKRKGIPEHFNLFNLAQITFDREFLWVTCCAFVLEVDLTTAMRWLMQLGSGHGWDFPHLNIFWMFDCLSKWKTTIEPILLVNSCTRIDYLLWLFFSFCSWWYCRINCHKIWVLATSLDVI